jgi:glucose-1-phosphate adenylyltransferase
MDLQQFINNHIDTGAEISIATTACTRADASGFGIMKVNDAGYITEFMEKPAPDLDIDDWKIPQQRRGYLPPEKEYLASMGIYIFDAKVMDAALDNDFTDFGREVIPAELKHRKVMSYIHDGYWEDIGTIRNFYDANIDLTRISPPFNIYDERKPLYSSPMNLPPSKINQADMKATITSEGCIITQAKLTNCVIGFRTVIESGTHMDGVICMGSDFYESETRYKPGMPPLGIGKNCRIRQTIIDTNARIGEGCSIGMKSDPYESQETDAYQIVDGIIVIKKDAVIPAGTVI